MLWPRLGKFDLFRNPALYLASVLFLLLVSTASAQSAPGNSHQFLLTSDIHFNPMADPALVSALSASPPTQWESILNQSKFTAFSRYGQDTNWWLLRSALNQMRQTLPNPAFILITGDLLAHDFPPLLPRRCTTTIVSTIARLCARRSTFSLYSCASDSLILRFCRPSAITMKSAETTAFIPTACFCSTLPTSPQPGSCRRRFCRQLAASGQL